MKQGCSPASGDFDFLNVLLNPEGHFLCVDGFKPSRPFIPTETKAELPVNSPSFDPTSVSTCLVTCLF